MENEDHNLARFLDAQQQIYAIALSEIKSGKKKSHWMWFIFPQLQGLGVSETAKHYAIADAAEAEAYLEHPVLGKRLVDISGELLHLNGKTASGIFGYPDDMKLKSSMTLFAVLPNANPVFGQVLLKYFDQPDAVTLGLLKKQL